LPRPRPRPSLLAETETETEPPCRDRDRDRASLPRPRPRPRQRPQAAIRAAAAVVDEIPAEAKVPPRPRCPHRSCLPLGQSCSATPTHDHHSAGRHRRRRPALTGRPGLAGHDRDHPRLDHRGEHRGGGSTGRTADLPTETCPIPVWNTLYVNHF